MNVLPSMTGQPAMPGAVLTEMSSGSRDGQSYQIVEPLVVVPPKQDEVVAHGSKPENAKL